MPAKVVKVTGLPSDATEESGATEEAEALIIEGGVEIAPPTTTAEPAPADQPGGDAADG